MPCLDDNAVLAFVRGDSSPEGIEAHLDRCPRCRALVSEIVQTGVAEDAETEDARGATLEDRFEVGPFVASGAMGAVHRGLDRLTGGPVAVKFLRRAGSADEQRFDREVSVLSNLRHPHIVRYVAHGRDRAACPYVVTEWIDGRTLGSVLAERRLTVAESAQLASALAEALAAAHRVGVVHRDLKPTNVMLVGGELARLKVIDFGLARVAASAPLTASGVVLGTPGYMAPEQVRGESVDARADVFALGCILFRCLTGSPAFPGSDVISILLKTVGGEAPTLDEALPTELRALVSRMLEMAPDDRPADGAQVSAELARIGVWDVAVASRRQPGAPPRLSSAEQRLVAVVVAKAPEPRPVDALASRYGGRAEQLPTGVVAIRLAGIGDATELVEKAARCAAELRVELDGAVVAIASGRGAASVGDLIALEDPSRIRIDDLTAALLRPRLPIAVDELGAYIAEQDPTPTLLGRATPFVGRDRELGRLLDLQEECAADGVARAAVVLGRAGIGKSRLLHELFRRIHARGEAVVWIGRTNSAESGAVFGVLSDALRRAAGFAPEEPLAARHARLEAFVAARVPAADAPRVAMFLGELCGAPFPAEDHLELRTARHDSRLLGDEVRRAFLDLLRAATTRPLVVLVDDLHWGDRASVSLLEVALLELRDRPLLVLGAGRPETLQRFPSLWAAREASHVHLAGLRPKAVHDLARRVLGDGVSEASIDRLVQRADGNAFYVEELLRATAEGRSELPEAIVAMAGARIDALERDARRTLRAASVFGEAFTTGAVAALVGDELARAWLDPLVERELLARTSPGAYAFRHALLREAAYATFTDADRALGHRLAAGFLAGDADAGAVAQHHELAGAPAEAVTWYARAARQALGANDFDAALELAERGVRAGAEGEALGVLNGLEAEAHKWRGDYPSVVRCGLAAAGRLEVGSSEWADAVADAVRGSEALGQLEPVLGLVGELVAALRAPRVNPRCASAAARASICMRGAGRDDLGDALLEAAERARPPPDEEALARIDYARGFKAVLVGDPGEGADRFGCAAERSERLGDLRFACASRVNAGVAELELGMFAASDRTFHAALELAKRFGARGLVAFSQMNLSFAFGRQGRLDEARRGLLAAIDVFVQQGDRSQEGPARRHLSIVLLADGDREGAEREARAAVALLEIAPSFLPLALVALARVLCASDRAAEAADVARRAVSLGAEHTGASFGQGQVGLALAEALEACGRRDEAREAIAEARRNLLARAARIGDPERRASFLENVPEHARTLELAAAWLGEGGANGSQR